MGFLPLAISASFLAYMLAGLAQGTLVRQPDEGAAAHLFQLLMPLQFAAIVWFAVAWLPKRPWSAAWVLAVQVAASFAVLSIVYFRHL